MNIDAVASLVLVTLMIAVAVFVGDDS